jgi:FixJ family two-component response regulator
LRVEEITEDRLGVLLAANDLLEECEKQRRTGTVTFMDEDRAEGKLRSLMVDALRNLQCQKGFTANRDSLSELLDPLREQDREFTEAIMKATIRAAAIASGLDTGEELTRIIADSAKTLPATEYERFRAQLDAFPKVYLEGLNGRTPNNLKSQKNSRGRRTVR